MAFDFDVYLMDEVSSAGDERFRKRSRARLEELNQKADFMLVDHNLWGLQFHCNRALLLHNGGLIEFDDLDEAIFSITRSLFLFICLSFHSFEKCYPRDFSSVERFAA